MKIDNVNLASSIVGASAQEERKVRKSKNSSFSNTFANMTHENEKEFLENKLKEIGEKGKFVKERMDLKDLVEYKKMIADFLEYTVKYSYKYSKETKLGRDGSFRVMGIVKKINEQLESLTTALLNNEKDRLKIVNTISGIHGMLVDLLM
ncbi:MAG: YaaR family protein [Clostridia bacterium]|nr:YaaR family protein [Clostridia bacterium]